MERGSNGLKWDAKMTYNIMVPSPRHHFDSMVFGLSKLSPVSTPYEYLHPPLRLPQIPSAKLKTLANKKELGPILLFGSWIEAALMQT